MKLATAALAALALVGCATENDGEGGAHAFGLRPAKPSLDDPKPPIAGLNPAIQHILQGGLAMDIRGDVEAPDKGMITAEVINTPFPIDGICHSCEVVALRDQRNPSELNILDDYGNFFCRIWLQPDGRIESTDCR